MGKALRRRLIDQGQQTRLIDNHYVNNPIFGLLDLDGVRPLPAATWERVGEVRDAVIATIATLSPKEWSFIFTNDLIDSPKERQWVAVLESLATARSSAFMVVRLLCEPEELCRRIASPERQAMMKSISTDWIKGRIATEQVLDPQLPSTLTLDITSMAPDDAADRILAHRSGLADVSDQDPENDSLSLDP
ncbi:MAG: chloramphenicol phosphotransferase [Candidatus Dormibacteraceae bacterium]